LQEFFSIVPIFPLRQLHELRVPGYNVAVALAVVGHHTLGAVLYAVLRVAEVALALFPQSVEGAVAEQAVEILRVVRRMAGEELAFLVLEEGVVALLWLLVKGFAVGHDHVLLAVLILSYPLSKTPSRSILGALEPLAEDLVVGGDHDEGLGVD